MNITLKLFATLSDYLPNKTGSNQVTVNVREGATVGAIVEEYKLPPKLVHLVLVNGVYVHPQDRTTTALKEGDALAIWPPIAGG